MKKTNPKRRKEPEKILRDIVDLCADCDTCRPLMEEICLFFPELYRLWDQECASGVPITEAKLRGLMELCTLCGLCPCPGIPADALEAKSRFVDREGLPAPTRLLIDVPAMARIYLAEHLFDAGEYLARLQAEGRLDNRFTAITGRMVYFAPCHQREQKMGLPYLELLRLIPGIVIEQVGGDIDCCGMGGNFGFKTDFHEKSLAVGRLLMAKIRERNPQAIVTDCVSCRLQFNHELPYPVFHPMEILARAYQAGDAR